MTSQSHNIQNTLMVAVAILIGTTTMTGGLAAQETKPQDCVAQQVANIRSQLTEQDERIRQLETAVQQLAASGDLPGGLTQVEPGWRSETNWHRLSTGMSETAVIAILGRPTRVVSGPASRTLYYESTTSDGVLRGSVRVEGEDWVESIHQPRRVKASSRS